jgi:hydroxymethylbilane synthase
MARSAVRIATRGSRLARWQAERVASLLGGACELVVVQTSGDRQADRPISQIGGQGVFVKEVQAAVLSGRADVAVHSAKDLPSGPAAGLVIGAVPERADPRDVLVGSTLGALTPGSVVATGSVRRRVQLAAARPDLTFTELRGNVDTRLSRAERVGAVVMAAAALERLSLSERVAEVLDPSVVLPQVGQGTLAVECREDDAALLSRLAPIDDPDRRAELEAERAFLAEMGGGCDLPVGALARRVHGELALEAMVGSIDGHVVLRRHRVGGDPVALGRGLGRHLLDDCGGAGLVASVAGGR